MSTTTTAFTSGTYYLSARTQRTYLQFNDGSPGTLLTAWQFSGDTAQQWQIDTVSNSNPYTVQNVRYKNYVTTALNGTRQYVVQDASPKNWYIRQVDSDHIVIAPDPGFTQSWNVMNGFSDDNNPIIIYPLNEALDNSVWSVIPIGSVTSSSSSTSSSTNAASSSSSTSTNPSVSGSASDESGLSLDNKIGLGVGIGFGVPTLLLTLWGIMVTIKAAKGFYRDRRGMHKVADSDDGHELRQQQHQFHD